MPNLTIVILSYNVKELLLACLDTVFADPNSKSWQVIVVDNASTDDSVVAVKKKFKNIELLISDKNIGFSAGNNLGVNKAKADYVLFLNPDTIVVGNAISNTLEYLKTQKHAGAITCKVELGNGQIDYSSHRGLPTPWNALSYFLGLSKIFPNSKLFAGYTATYLDLNTIHEVDCITGAFLLVKREAAEKIGWWDEEYFWNGEDIEFCYQLKQNGWKILYYPNEKIIHFKGSSAKQNRLTTAKLQTSAMRTFFKKHYSSNPFILTGIWILEQLRIAKTKYA